ncbi:hypothetical protein PENSPDRAFT_694368 [Peniophora sp. CONT]|nr:hypothetical protein PENSPDRAFT_694368 [Peniophora sp. CONT]
MPSESELARLAETAPPPSGLDDDVVRQAKKRNPNNLNGTELRWRWYYPWLKQRGYLISCAVVMNRIGSPLTVLLSPIERTSPRVLDATRISDGRHVVLKAIPSHREPDREREIHEYLCSPHLRSDPRNHTAELLDAFRLPNNGDLVLVTPVLRRLDNPRFQTVGEAVGFFRQLFEAIQFLHSHRIAHGDCTSGNIMFDATPMYPEGFHLVNTNRSRDWYHKAKQFTRTERPVRYIVIDFGLSVQFHEGDTGLVYPPAEGNHIAPEHNAVAAANQTPQSPFPTDIYYLGNLIRERFIVGYTGLSFMEDLVTDMMKEVPADRPSMDDVVARFDEICASLHWWTLRRPIDWRWIPAVIRWVRVVPIAFRQLRYICSGTSSIPVPAD